MRHGSVHCFMSFDIQSNFPFSAGNPYTAAEALLMLLESPPEPLASPMEEECLYAENFDKCCEIIKILSGPKKNTFLYICMFLNELLKFSLQNRLEAVKLGEFKSVLKKRFQANIMHSLCKSGTLNDVFSNFIHQQNISFFDFQPQYSDALC